MASPGASPVPVRTILATIGLVLGTIAGILMVRELGRVLAWLAVAAFFAVVLTPAVDWLERRRIRRSLATVIVFLVGIGVVAGLLYAFIRPIANRADSFVERLPEFVEDARDGRGPVGRLVQRYDIDEYVEENQERLQEAIRNAGAPALDIVRSVANTLFALLTILVLTFLMLLEGPHICQGVVNMIDEHRRDRVRLVAADCAKAVTGYVAGNLLISVIAGLTTFAFLTLIGVPFSGALGLWVAFTDLIPLVGATLGAIPTVAIAFVHSTPAGIAALIFYIVYQQIENHFLQPTVMSRTVNLNPLAVLVSVLAGVELFGVLGALLAIPVAGVIQVIGRDLWDERRGRPKEEPTVGTDEIPVTDIVVGTPEPAPAPAPQPEA